MTAISVSAPFPILTDIDGSPLDAGYVYIGQANLDPVAFPKSVYWDASLTTPAAQPIRTSGGYPVRNGSPARVYVDGDYSIRINSKNGTLVYSSPASTDRLDSWQISYDGGTVQGVLDVVTGPSGAASVGYTPAGAGAVATTVQAKLRETVSVKDFGAVGDGATDDTAAIQAAIDYCTVNFTNPTKLYFPFGIYKITNTLNIDNTIHMIGDKGAFNGSASYIKLYSASDIPAVYVGTGTSTYVYNFFMQDICITRDGINVSNYNTDKTGLYLDRVSESLIKNCAIGGFKYGILCHEVTITDFDKLQVYYNETGIWLQDQKPGGSTAYTSGMNNFFRCNVFKNKYGVQLGGELNHFIGCHFEVSEAATFYVDNALTAQTRHINIKDCNIRSEDFNTTRALLINQGDITNPLRVFQINIEGTFASSNSSPYAIEVKTTTLTTHNVKVNLSNCSFFGVATSAAYSNATTTTFVFDGQIRVRELVTGAGNDMPRTSGSFSPDGRRAGVMMKLSANQTTTNNITSTLSWGSSVYNNYGFWSMSNPTRLTIPNDVRLVRMYMSALWATNATGVRIIDVVKNGGNAFDGRSTVAMNAANTTTCQELVSPIIPVSPGDYFEFRATQTSGGNLDVVADQRTWVAIEVIE